VQGHKWVENEKFSKYWGAVGNLLGEIGGLKQHETEEHGSKGEMRTPANASVFTGRIAG
jgi:hypothetical protein